jgi:hypothetical protein
MTNIPQGPISPARAIAISGSKGEISTFIFAYIHPVFGAGVRTHDLLIMSRLP